MRRPSGRHRTMLRRQLRVALITACVLAAGCMSTPYAELLGRLRNEIPSRYQATGARYTWGVAGGRSGREFQYEVELVQRGPDRLLFLERACNPPPVRGRWPWE